MDVSHLANVVVPVEHPVIDDSTIQYGIDSTGATVKDATGRRVAIARDKVGGKWYAKVADHWPAQADQKAMIADGAVHLHSQKAELRGVWMPLDAPAAKAEDEPATKGHKKAA